MDAVRRISAIDAAQRSQLAPGRTVSLMSHGNRVARAIVLVHGYTSCPRQFHAFGRELFELGHNVLIAPLPHHGLPNLLDSAHASLTAAQLVAYSDEVLDIANGLGAHLTMAGLSAGGLLAAWAAQNRKDVDLAVPIAPAFGYRLIPTRLTRPASILFRALPNFFTWWDPLSPTDPRSAYTYPRFASHPLAELMHLGFSVSDTARHRRPAARRILLVLNENDRAVNNSLALGVAALWRRSGADVLVHEFPATLELPHDLIDPFHPRSRTNVVYPTLIDLMSKQPTPSQT